MTLTDIFHLQQEIAPCSSAAEVQRLLDDNGEDNDMASAQSVYDAISSEVFVWGNDKAYWNKKEISCPDCHTASPDKILSNAVEVLSGKGTVHFGCCECGTMFSICEK